MVRAPRGCWLWLLAPCLAACGARTELLADLGAGAGAGSGLDPCAADGAPRCVTPTTLRTYDAACEGGACAFTDTVCPLGCSRGTCNASTNPRAIGFADGFGCVLVGDAVKCWGRNDKGQLGNGSLPEMLVSEINYVATGVVGLSSGVRAVSVGSEHACALTTAGGVLCWGSNHFWQLGGGTTGTSSATPVGVTGLSSGVVAIAAGGNHTCALTSAGAVMCWGWNNFGELGDGSRTESPVPVAVRGLPDGVVAIAAGNSNACVITSSGTLMCWGVNYPGAIGHDETSQSFTPVDDTGLRCVIDVSLGENHSCALTSTGAVACWGLNGTNELGSAFPNESRWPLEVAGLPEVVGLSVGYSRSVALTSTGALMSWGEHDPTPALIPGLSSGVVAVATGNEPQSCALLVDGAVKCRRFDHPLADVEGL